MRLLYLVTVLVFAIDQLSKYFVVHVMNLAQLGAIDVLPPFLNFRMAWNTGINFGLFSDDASLLRWGLIVGSIVISFLVYLWIRRDGGGVALEISGGLLIGGAFGNVIDRLLYGAVADFLNMSCCGITNPFAFNVADVAIFAGAAGLIVFAGREKSA